MCERTIFHFQFCDRDLFLSSCENELIFVSLLLIVDVKNFVLSIFNLIFAPVGGMISDALSYVTFFSSMAMLEDCLDQLYWIGPHFFDSKLWRIQIMGLSRGIKMNQSIKSLLFLIACQEGITARNRLEEDSLSFVAVECGILNPIWWNEYFYVVYQIPFLRTCFHPK